MNQRYPMGLLLLSVVSFLVSLALPAFSYSEINEGARNFPGWSALLMGAFGALLGLLQILDGHSDLAPAMAWFANPLLLGTWLCVLARLPRAAMVLGLASLACSCIFLPADILLVPENRRWFNVQAAAGYYLWTSSMVCALVAAAWRAPKGLRRVMD